MLVLHLSTTPQVGAPGEICRALRLCADVQARWAVLQTDVGAYGRMAFELDLLWESDREEIIDLAERCDVLHLHNFLDLNSTAFDPIDIRQRWDRGGAIVRHFHSTPALIAKVMKLDEQAVHDCPIPKLAIAQYPERFIPKARLVPNIVNLPTTPVPRATGQIRIGYAPSRFNSARSSRWDTKGYPETIKLLKNVQRRGRRLGLHVEVDIIEQVSHSECLARKSTCHIIVDDLATGSYHLNTLESLAAGSVVVAYVDRRTLSAVHDVTGRSDFPVIIAGLEDADEVLFELCRQPTLVAEAGMRSREWMAQYWNPRVMADHFVRAYMDVLEQPRAGFMARHDESLAAKWEAVGQHDVLWHSRMRRWPRLAPTWWTGLRATAGRLARLAALKK